MQVTISHDMQGGTSVMYARHMSALDDLLHVVYLLAMAALVIFVVVVAFQWSPWTLVAIVVVGLVQNWSKSGPSGRRLR